MFDTTLLYDMSTDNCGTVCSSRSDNYLGLELPGIGAILIIMAVQGVFYFIILFSIESSTGNRARQMVSRLGRRGHGDDVAPDDLRPQPSQVGFPDEDEDVANEREYILGTPLERLCSSETIVIYGLTKSFSGFRAVDSLTFRVPRVQPLHFYCFFSFYAFPFAVIYIYIYIYIYTVVQKKNTHLCFRL